MPWAVSGRQPALPFHQGRSRVTSTLRERHLYPPTPPPSSSIPALAQLPGSSDTCTAQNARFDTDTSACKGVRVTGGEGALHLPAPGSPPALCPQPLAALPRAAAFPHFYQALSCLILLLLSLTALPLLSLFQSKFFTLSLFSSLSLAHSFFFLLFFKILSAFCASLSLSCHFSLSSALLSPPRLCLLRSPPCTCISPPHLHLPSPLAGSHPAPSVVSNAVAWRERPSSSACISPFSLSFPLFPYTPALSPISHLPLSSLSTCSPDRLP